MKAIIHYKNMLRVLMILGLNYSLVFSQNKPDGSAYPSGTATSLLPSNYVSGVKVNYVRSTKLNIPVTNEAGINPQNPLETNVSTSYSDGLGRNIQTVNHFASPAQNDLVTAVKYDNFGRAAWQFLPYTKSEATAADNGKFKLTTFSDQKNFYKTTLGYAADNYFYTQTNYEASPLNRVVKSLPQGNSWVGNNRGVTVTENPLPAGANIRIFTIGYSPGVLPVTSAVYATGELMVKTTTDEDGYFTEEYTNKENQLVLKTTGKTGNATKLFTYYVYDDYGLLRHVIPPNATLWLANNSWTLTTAKAKEICFNYTYDVRLRLTIKELPGVDPQYLIYNQKNELIFTQTSTQRAKGMWLFNKYDGLGRLIQTGTYSSTAAHATMQNLFSSPTYTGPDVFLQYMFKDVYGTAAYQSSFSNAKVLSTNYYDDYSFTTRTYNNTYMPSLQQGWNMAVSQETTNLLTGTKIVVLDGAVSPTELLTVNFYNDRGLLLQTQTQNHKGGWNTITHSYDFQGQKQGTYTELNNPQASNNTNIKTIESFYYDHTGRLQADFMSLNGQPPIPVISNGYDELGRLDNKNFSNGFDPTLKYEYNVRNWMTAINKEFCLEGSTGQTFGMQLSYDYGYINKYYNGNIAGMKWRNSGKVTEARSYGYQYDDYNRLKSGDYTFKVGPAESGTPWSNATKDFTASNMTYDHNGNIQSMKHMGMNGAGTKIILDDMYYAYTPNGNKLQAISETGSSQSANPTVYDGLGDFRDVSGNQDYTYDTEGNLLTDANKSLTYSYDEIINKTKRVTKAGVNVDYLYDVTGTKLQKKVSPAALTTTDYIGSAVYINNSLSFISHPEGRIRYNASSPTPFMYDYFVKDHLGSTRSVITVTNGAITGFAKSEATASNEVVYLATSEPENAAKENQLFDNIETTRSANPNKKIQTDNYVAKIYSKNDKTILGPDITLRVMAGDTVKISAEALYIAEKGNVKEVANNVANNFITAFTAPVTLAVEGASKIANSGMDNLATSVLNLQNQTTRAGAPKAFLNYILYDDQMKLIKEGSGAIQVQEKDGWQTLETDQIRIPENGFLRVFSNNQEEAPVSMNNTMVTVIPGKLVEEYNYYPYGLVFGASSVSSSIKKTDYLYNGKELQHNEFGQGNGLELEDYGARMYDPQIARWTQVDPLTENGRRWSPYTYAFDNPVIFIDPDGMWPDWSVSDVVHASLDVAGLVPGLGEIADGINAVVYLAEGDYSNAALSVAAMVPLAGTAVTAVKFAKTADKVVTGAKTTEKVVTTAKTAEKASTGKKTFQTYNKEAKDPSKHGRYSGRTSGKGTPEENIAKRDKNHHMNDTHGPARLDKSSENSDAIRGREQQNITNNGGAQSENGTSGNAINSISPNNPKRQQYIDAANKEFP